MNEDKEKLLLQKYMDMPEDELISVHPETPIFERSPDPWSG
jgi:hypothetical protein